MKKALALVLALVLCLALFAGCNKTDSSVVASGDNSVSTAGPQTIQVVTSYGGDDGNRTLYEEAVAAYEAATGNKVSDQSGTANEDWKAQVHTSFQGNAEPDVLFFFNGIDSEPLVKNNKLVSLKEIRAEYPDYASNMDDGRMAPSAVDGETYFVPVNGFWEAMFVNTKILADAGVEVPGTDYTMDQFKKDCDAIKAAGFTPIAASLHEVPHYWFEFVAINYTSPANHLTVPTAGDTASANWAKGLDDLKALYEAGYFPTNTLTATDAETCQIFFDGEAAFLVDGSWKTGAIVENCPDTLEDYSVVYPPSVAGETRKASDLIGGISMGYAITRKAWDSERRDAAIAFIKHMTSDDNVSAFCGAVGSNALKGGSTAATKNSLEEKVVAMIKGSTSFTGAVQDAINGEQKTYLFTNVKNICTGSMTSADALAEMVTIEEAPAEEAAE